MCHIDLNHADRYCIFDPRPPSLGACAHYCERRHLAPVRPQGLPLDLNPLYIPLLLVPPIKPLPFSACKQAVAGREVATHHIYTYLACSYVALPGTYIHDKSHITYVTPAHPRRCLRSRCERRHLLPSAPKGGSLVTYSLIYSLALGSSSLP